jgi:dTDP-glucose 4,6-dehydratase
VNSATLFTNGGAVLIAGGAGFIGTNLTRSLLSDNVRVICVDNLSSGVRGNVEQFLDNPLYTFVERDVCEPFDVSEPIGFVFNLASPASPPTYLARPLETLRVGSIGTEVLIQLALKHDAPFVMASTSEVYGDPTEHPQKETYWGNVNSIGPRSVYDEAKRYAEALCFAYHRTHGLQLRLARIFNTYGPSMQADDGRVVTNFVNQALSGHDLTIYGDGSQTRSFCYVDDLVAGLRALAESNFIGPVNLGNPSEFTMMELATLVLELTGKTVAVSKLPLPQDDPVRRCPDISVAQRELRWNPSIPLREGLQRTIKHFIEIRSIENPSNVACTDSKVKGLAL